MDSSRQMKNWRSNNGIILSGSLDVEAASDLIVNQPFGYLDDVTFKFTVVEYIKEKYK
jgi:hypothetical protein